MNTPYAMKRAMNTKRARGAFSSSLTRGSYELRMESVPLDSSHFFVPVQPEHWRLNGEEKDIYFSKLLDGVMCVHGASAECKRRILEMRTGLPHLTSELREISKGS